MIPASTGGGRGRLAAVTLRASPPKSTATREIAGGACGRRSRRPVRSYSAGAAEMPPVWPARGISQSVGRRAAGVAVGAVERLVAVALHPADEQDGTRRDPRHQVGEVRRRQVVGEHDAGRRLHRDRGDPAQRLARGASGMCFCSATEPMPAPSLTTARRPAVVRPRSAAASRRRPTARGRRCGRRSRRAARCR